MEGLVTDLCNCYTILRIEKWRGVDVVIENRNGYGKGFINNNINYIETRNPKNVIAAPCCNSKFVYVYMQWMFHVCNLIVLICKLMHE